MQSQHLHGLRRKRHPNRLLPYADSAHEAVGVRDGNPVSEVSEVVTFLTTVVQDGSIFVSQEVYTTTVPASSAPSVNPSSSFTPTSGSSSSASQSSVSGSGPTSLPSSVGRGVSSSTSGPFSSSGSFSASSSVPSSSFNSSSSSFFSSSSSSSSSFSSSFSLPASSSSIPSSSPSSSSSASSSASSVAPLVALTVPPVSSSAGPTSIYTPPVYTPSSTSAASEPSLTGAGLTGASRASKSGLSGGAIGGIVVACVAVAIIAGLFIVRKCCLSRREKRRETWLDTTFPKYPFSNADAGAGVDADGPRASAIPAPSSRDDAWVGFERFERVGPQMAQQPVPTVSLPAAPPMAFNSSAAPAHDYVAPTQPVGYPTMNPAAPTPALALAPATQPVAFAVVRSTFVPTLPDELSIVTGERVRIVAAYDDGWALCKSMRGEQGVVPLECLQREGEGAQPQGLQVQTAYPGKGTGDWRLSHRQSSLYAAESPASAYN